MEILDAQLHAHPPDNGTVGRPERPSPQAAMAASHVTGDELVVMMRSVGVDGAVLVHPSTLGADATYPLGVAADYPGMFGVVAVPDPFAQDVEEVVARWLDQPRMLALRVVLLTSEHEERFRSGDYDRLFSAAERHDVPVLVFPPRLLGFVAEVARRHPDLPLIVDHLGLAQPPLMTPDPDPFETLPDLVSLAQFDNVSVKCSGIPTLSREAFPFPDIWPHVHRVLDAFGVHRVMWGTDITRVDNHTYREAVSYMRDTNELSGSDKEHVLGKTLRTILRWQPESAASAASTS